MLKSFEKGFTLLETLLVIGIVAGILIFSVNQYRAYERQADLAAVKSDVTLIRQALNRYYHIQGCQTDGRFAGNLTPTIVELGLPASYENREPIVSGGYSAVIVDTQHKTASGKPIYRLRVKAVLPASYNAAQVHWYANALHGTVAHGTTLQWTGLPNVADNKASQTLWVLNGQAAQFKAAKTKAHSSKDYYYCAN